MYKKVSIPFHGRELSIESGKVAKQTSGAVVITYGESVILVTAVAEKNPSAPSDFVPITVNYQEKFWAAGKIPGGFFKRETRSTDIETLNCRLIDRPIRPLFPKGWRYETQIMPTVLSTDHGCHLGVLALVGASAALEVSHIPFEGPVAGVQVGRINGEWKINPTFAEMEESDVDLIVAGNRNGITMVEGGAAFVPEEQLLEGIFFGYRNLIPLLDLQDELRLAVGKPKEVIEPLTVPAELKQRVEAIARADAEAAWRIPTKIDRHDRLREIWSGAMKKLEAEGVDFGPNHIYFEKIHEQIDTAIIRNMVTKDQRRADGRDLDTVRPITIEIGVLPRPHGSALFTRGETQALVVTTLGTRKDERKIEKLEEEYYKTFYLNYVFPPYCVGEVKMRLAPGRREIGHGNLAERALAAALPDHDDFPYTIRVASEITESNGSSSMATVCGGSLALMDAGVQIKGQVAGVAMGLVKEDEGKFHVLTDILGDEDHCGDMDFKVAGSAEGVTAVQMDIKIGGLDQEIMGQALSRARVARLHILGEMNKVIDRPRAELSPHAPRIVTIQIPVDRIRDLIGPGGKVVRGIVEQTGATIDIEDDGTVRVGSSDAETNDKVIRIIRELTAVPEEGATYTGVIKRVVEFGAFVEILPGIEGLLHISEIEHRRLDKVTDVLNEGDTVTVKLLSVEANGKFRLSRRALLEKGPDDERSDRDRGERGGGGRDRGDRGGGGGGGGRGGDRGGRDRGKPDRPYGGGGPRRDSAPPRDSAPRDSGNRDSGPAGSRPYDGARKPQPGPEDRDPKSPNQPPSGADDPDRDFD